MVDTTWLANICICEQHLIIANSLQDDGVEAFLVDLVFRIYSWCLYRDL